MGVPIRQPAYVPVHVHLHPPGQDTQHVRTPASLGPGSLTGSVALNVPAAVVSRGAALAWNAHPTEVYRPGATVPGHPVGPTSVVD
ncbi:MAG: hypothetical protein ACRDSH_25350 [Pseudonocardiaceae bacterium]